MQYGSNVAEQIVQHGGAAGLEAMMAEVTEVGCLEELVAHQFGNYVIQRIIERCDAAQVKLLGARCGPPARAWQPLPAASKNLPVDKRMAQGRRACDRVRH